MRIAPAVFDLLEDTVPPTDGWHVCEIVDVDEVESRHNLDSGKGVRLWFEVVAGESEGTQFACVYNTRARDEVVRNGAARAMVRVMAAALGRGKFPRAYTDLVGCVLAVRTEMVEKECADGQTRETLRVLDVALAGDVGVSVNGGGA